ncbi:MAG: hypothetical protein EAX96_17450 [Candidatus Lokiarchaeota archaeon]|nr:hypothetical protein [Candidatus Lokiarchaeota archaeon]
MELPIKDIVLYKTGIGYFQRKGTIKGNSLKLNFRKEMMNDILATLTILTTNSQVTGVSYEGQDIDLQTALEDVLIKLSPQSTFLTLLKQVVGCKISIDISSTKYEGTLLGIQELPIVIEENIVNQQNLVLQKDDDGTILNLPILEIRNFKMLDDKMQGELEYFLQKIYESKKENNKTLTIFFDNVPSDGDEVEINYLQEIPAWKCSYRLVFTEEQVMIQGWSMVDNILDEDWINVNLSLIAGLPISFIYDLYSPNWIKRPEVERKDKYDITVTEFEEAKEEYEKMDKKKAARPPPSPPMAAPAPGAGKFYARAVSPKIADIVEEEAFDMDDEFSMERTSSSVKVTTEGEAEGDFFQYRIGVPITVSRNQSSLVPILQTYVKGQKISVYNEQARKNNPMLTVELENTSDLTLEEGPISLYEGARFTGEAMLPFMKKGEMRRIPYAIDLGVSVEKKLKSYSAKTHSIKIQNRGVYTYNFYIKEFTYTLINKTQDEEKEVIVEHPIESNYELFDTIEPFEKTKNFYRFKLKIDPKKKDELIIKTRYLSSSITNYEYVNKSFIENLLKLKLINETENDFLLKMIKLMHKKNETMSDLNALKSDKNNIFNDQSRLRQNLKSLKATSSETRLRDKYISKLEDEEDKLERIEDAIKSLEIKAIELEEKIKDLIKNHVIEE